MRKTACQLAGAFQAHTLHLLQRRPITTSLICLELHTHPEFSEGELSITYRRKAVKSGLVQSQAAFLPGAARWHGHAVDAINVFSGH